MLEKFKTQCQIFLDLYYYLSTITVREALYWNKLSSYFIWKNWVLNEYYNSKLISCWTKNQTVMSFFSYLNSDEYIFTPNFFVCYYKAFDHQMNCFVQPFKWPFEMANCVVYDLHLTPTNEDANTLCVQWKRSNWLMQLQEILMFARFLPFLSLTITLPHTKNTSIPCHGFVINSFFYYTRTAKWGKS